MARGEFNFRQVGPNLLEETVGDVVIRLIAEYDPTAGDPPSTLRFRFGRAFGEGDASYIKNGVTFTGANVDAYLAVLPKVLKRVAELKSRLPVKDPVTVTRSKTRDDLGNELARRLLGEAQPTIQTAVGAMPVAPQYAQPAPAQPAPAQPAKTKAKRPF